MAKFQCIIHQDAWLNHIAIIEASSAEEAAEIAERAWKLGDDNVKFEEDDLHTFDEAICMKDDCMEVDHEGNPIA